MKRLAVFALGALLLAACSTASLTKSERLPLDQATIKEIKRVAARDLKDPGSAQFRNIRKLRNTYSDGSTGTFVCGEINAKNSYGAYTGFVTFYGSTWHQKFNMLGMATPSTNYLLEGTCP